MFTKILCSDSFVSKARFSCKGGSIGPLSVYVRKHVVGIKHDCMKEGLKEELIGFDPCTNRLVGKCSLATVQLLFSSKEESEISFRFWLYNTTHIKDA